MVKHLDSLFRAALSPQILQMVCKVYIPVLFPLTFCIAVTALWIDNLAGWQNGFLPPQWNAVIAVGNALEEEGDGRLTARLHEIADDLDEPEMVRQTARDVLNRLEGA